MKIFGHSVILTFRFCCSGRAELEVPYNSPFKACLKNMPSNKDNSAAGSRPTICQLEALARSSYQTIIDAEKKVDNDVSPVSTVGAETLALDIWDTQGNNLTDTLAHNHPRPRSFACLH